MSGPEFEYVENPFLDQLASMGWKVITGSVDHPSVTGRENFREVLIRDDLAKALRRINLRDGKPWLDEARLSQAIAFAGAAFLTSLLLQGLLGGAKGGDPIVSKVPRRQGK